MNNINDLPWAEPGVSKRYNDVSICINKSGSKNNPDRRSLVFRFTLDAANKIAPNSEYVTYALICDIGRVYFKSCDRSKGFKLSKTSNTRTVTHGSFDMDKWAPLVGRDYKLLHDDEMNLYYIEV